MSRRNHYFNIEVIDDCILCKKNAPYTHDDLENWIKKHFIPRNKDFWKNDF